MAVLIGDDVLQSLLMALWKLDAPAAALLQVMAYCMCASIPTCLVYIPCMSSCVCVKVLLYCIVLAAYTDPGQHKVALNSR